MSGQWKDGYWVGTLVDGYPETYFENDRFAYPWEKNVNYSVRDSVDKELKEFSKIICSIEKIPETT